MFDPNIPPTAQPTPVLTPPEQDLDDFIFARDSATVSDR